MDSALPTIDKYYVTKADAIADSIYCHHDLMGELFVPEHLHDKAQFLYTEGDVVFVTTSTKSYFLPARHFLWIPAGVSHSIISNSTSVMILTFHI